MAGVGSIAGNALMVVPNRIRRMPETNGRMGRGTIGYYYRVVQCILYDTVCTENGTSGLFLTHVLIVHIKLVPPSYSVG